MQFVFGRQAQFHSPHVLTIGNFDGVHIGHQRVIRQAQEIAACENLPLTVLLFEPQPKEYFASHHGQDAPARLMSLKAKVDALKSLGVDSIWCLKFADIRPMSSAQFVKNLVVDKQVKRLVVGDDFRFGCDREGDFQYLSERGSQLGFSVAQSETHRIDGERISSSRIRQLLNAHDFETASKLLGRPYSLCGRVNYGQQLGRKIGFPTANIPIFHTPPLHGVYGSSVRVPKEGLFTGVANIGSRPTVSGQKVRLEVHLHGFDAELYGLDLNVTPRVFIRAEQKFESIDGLTEQIRLDNQKAQEMLSVLTGSEIA